MIAPNHSDNVFIFMMIPKQDSLMIAKSPLGKSIIQTERRQGRPDKHEHLALITAI